MAGPVNAAIPIAAPCVTAVSVMLGIAAPGLAGIARRHVEAVSGVRRHVEVARHGRGRVEVAGVVGRPFDCTAVLNATALRAMGQTGPLGQMQIYGDPMAFGPNLRRVGVDVFGGGGGQYDVDITIDDDCHVLSVTPRLASNGPP